MRASQKYGASPIPTCDGDALALCGWAGPEKSVAAQSAPGFGQFWKPFAMTMIPKGFDSAGQTVRGWELFRKGTDGGEPDLSAQPTGNCVAAAYDDATELLQCVQICAGTSSQFKSIYNPYHYATGRVLIGKNQLRGGAGSLGSWQAEAGQKYGVLEIQPGLPAYTKANVDAWGDGRVAEGKDFKNFLKQGELHLVKDSAFTPTWEELRDALFARRFGTIASSCGYTMNAGKDGFHHPSGTWQHQMSIWGYSENPKYPKWIAIKNQWGDCHGEIIDFETGEKWPRGFLRVPLDAFIQYHLRLRGTECIVYSDVIGFPVPKLNTGIWTRKSSTLAV